MSCLAFFTFRAGLEGRWQPGASVPCYVRAYRDADVHEHRLSCHGGRRFPTFAVVERAGKVCAGGGAGPQNIRLSRKLTRLIIEYRNLLSYIALKHSRKTKNVASFMNNRADLCIPHQAVYRDGFGAVHFSMSLALDAPSVEPKTSSRFALRAASEHGPVKT